LEQSGVPAVERYAVSGEHVAGVLAWKQELPDGKAAMVLVNDGKGANALEVSTLRGCSKS